MAVIGDPFSNFLREPSYTARVTTAPIVKPYVDVRVVFTYDGMAEKEVEWKGVLEPTIEQTASTTTVRSGAYSITVRKGNLLLLETAARGQLKPRK